VIVAYALASVGQIDEACRLAELDLDSQTPSIIRSQAESALAAASWRDGDMNKAIRHAQSAVRLAQEAADTERIAWAHLHLFRLLIERGPLTNVLAALPDARRVVARAGIPQATAHLHICVSVLEAQMGRRHEARRHCDIAESLLQIAPNAYCSGSLLQNRGCICVLDFEFAKGLELLRRAKQLASQSGHVQTAIAAENNIAHIQLHIGDFVRARGTFRGVLDDTRVTLFTKLSAMGGSARVHLALGELDECEAALRVISEQTAQNEGTANIYHVRWETLTAARLLIRQGRVTAAIDALEFAYHRYKDFGDTPLVAFIHLGIAHAYARADRFSEVPQRLLAASELGITEVTELQAQYYYASSQILGELAAPLSLHLRNRAVRLWKDQGIVSIRLEMDDGPADTSQDTDTRSVSAAGTPIIECVTDSLSAFSDLAHRPRLLGDEMILVIEALACSPDARLVETREKSDPPQASDATVVLPLGVDRKRQLTLVCRIPDDPVKAILLADVVRLGRSALALEKAREEERNRTALWPAPPIEEQAGALFIAEEMKALLATARRIAPTSVPVLITGETGTGKEVLARTIHAYSSRASATFLPFNCSSVPKDMLDSQLFGHRRGAFTGAAEHFPGVIRAAAGGTLFLDEIGETTLDVQPKLLRFLESNEVHPIGETQPVHVDVRVIAATNADLDALVTQGRLREDLFYRLNIVRLHVPPLRERRVEIPSLAHHYLEKHAQEYRKGYLRLAEETMEYLVLYRWPGNVRQLANEMRRMAALAETDAVLMPEHLSAEIAASRRTIPPSERALDPTEIVVRIDQPMAAAVQHLECAMIQHALRTTGGRMEETAALLGVSRKGLYLKRVRYGLEPPEDAAVAELA
jgi:DNA-binding NtrC family response regulator/tetratricopeptide (TPR) repeat protein